MIFTLNLIYSLWCCSKLCYVFEHSNIRRNFLTYFILFTPLWFVWLLICGGQYGVGTDYFSYYEIFENVASDYYYNKSEWLFAWIIETCHDIGLLPQSLFFVFYFINFVFFFKILYGFEKKTAFLFVLLYITLSSAFNNQLNGLRQYSAIYIITFAIINFYENKSYLKYLLWIILAGGLHFSSYFALLFCLFFKMKTLSGSKTYYILIIVSSLFALVGSSGWVVDIFGSYIPASYSSYIDGGFNKSNDLINIITKLIFIPYYLLSVNVISHYHMNERDIFLYRMGIIAYSIRLFFLENFIFDRIGQLFVLVAILPIYIYLKYLYNNRKIKMCVFIILTFVTFYMIKTLLFPSREYLYQSIYFR